jgi:hypothetical protein
MWLGLVGLAGLAVGLARGENVTCAVLARFEDGTLRAVACGAVELAHASAEHVTPDDAAFWLYLAACAALVLTAGVMSGLTIGLVALDVTALTVLVNSGTATERRQAALILPVVRRHHLLLVTLLLANALCMEALPLLLDQVASPAVAIAVSVTAVLFFGEIIPQALCSRYGLAIGASLVYVLWATMALLLPVAWPIAKLLDCILGQGHSTYYRRSQLTELVNLHGRTGGTHADAPSMLRYAPTHAAPHAPARTCPITHIHPPTSTGSGTESVPVWLTQIAAAADFACVGVGGRDSDAVG